LLVIDLKLILLCKSILCLAENLKDL
jgi:hypothetical protein